MQRQPITTVVFDLDGVVLEQSCFASQLDQTFGITPQMTAAFFGAPFHRCQLGYSDLKSEVSRFLPNWGWSKSVDSFLEFWFGCDSTPHNEVLSMIRTLRSRGITCCLATNQERHRADFLRQTLSIETYFDAAFYSADLGFRKPAGEFFEAIECALRVRADHILFFDDSEENVVAAQNRGWIAHQFHDVGGFRIRLSALVAEQ